MNQLRLAVLITLLCQLIVGCSGSTKSDNTNTTNINTNQKAVESEVEKPLVGGFAAADSSDSDVLAAAEFAVTAESDKGMKLKLISISNARSQVVAGMNFSFTLTVDQDGKQKKADVVVYKDLQKNYSVTSWNWN